MADRRFHLSLVVVLLGVGVACDEDVPSTNTDGGAPAEPSGGNLNATETTPVAAGEDSIVQGNQPMQSFVEP